jgi:hypothetical protein
MTRRRDVGSGMMRLYGQLPRFLPANSWTVAVYPSTLSCETGGGTAAAKAAINKSLKAASRKKGMVTLLFP